MPLSRKFSLLAVVGFGLLGLGGRLLLSPQVTLVLLLSSVAGYVAVHRWFYWTRPSARLLALIQGARAGQVPIDELSSISFGPAALAGAVQQLLRDLRQQKCELAALQDEIRQRVQTRTDALERQLGSLRAQATRDPLTHLLNRRALDEALPALIGEAVEGRSDLAVIMLDVDHFKLLNDSKGHAAGDDFLKSIAQLLRSSVGPEHLAFRLGGDEFVLVLPNTSAAAANHLVQHLTALVDALVKPLRSPQPPRLSAGVAGLSSLSEKSPSALLHAADGALYSNKSLRKSRAA